MKISPLRGRLLMFALVSYLVLPCLVGAQEREMKCDGNLPPKHIELSKDDENIAGHLQLSREIPSGVPVTLNVCAANLTILGGDKSFLQLTIDMDKSSRNSNAADYLEALDITPQGVTLKLDFSERPFAKVLIVLPAGTPKVDLNLWKGNLSFESARIAGDRLINVADGHVDYLGNDGTYANLQANIAIGSLHDRRPGGKNKHLIVAQTLPGTGQGSVRINVAKGSVDLKPSN